MIKRALAGLAFLAITFVPLSAAWADAYSGPGALGIGTTVINGGTSNAIEYNNAGALGELATVNNGVLVTDGSGNPSFSTTLPTGLIGNFSTLSASSASTWTGGLRINGGLSPDGVSMLVLQGAVTSTGAGGTKGIGIIPTFTTNAGTTIVDGILINYTVNYNAAATVANLEGVYVSGMTLSGWSGTVPSFNVFEAGTMTNANAPFFVDFLADTDTNGNGITTGTVDNYAFKNGGSGFTAAAAAGGTINNYSAYLTVGNGSGAGTTSNYGLFIIGNGGSGGAGTTTNYAIFSSSTAASHLAGTLNLSPVSTAAAPLLTMGGSASTTGLYNTATSNFGVAVSGAVKLDYAITTASTWTLAGAVALPGLASSSAATTGTVCWTTSTGNLTVDTTLACLSSLEELKDIRTKITGAEALADVQRLAPVWGTWKEGTPEYAGDRAEQPFLTAHQVESVDKRLVGYGSDGKLRGVRYMELAAVLVAAIQDLKIANDNLEAEVVELRNARR